MRPANKKNGLFGVGFYFRKRRSPVVFSGPPFRKVFKVLDLALAYGPESMEIGPEILDLVERLRPAVDDPRMADAKSLVEDSRRLLELGELRPARKLLGLARSRGAGFPEFHLVEARVMHAKGGGYRRILNYLESIGAQRSQDSELRQFYYWHALSRKNPTIADEAVAYWKSEDTPPSMGAILSDYFVNRGDFPRAADILRRTIERTDKEDIRSVLEMKLRKVELLNNSGWRRLLRHLTRPLFRERRMPGWVGPAFTILSFGVGVGFAIWMKALDRDLERQMDERRSQFEEQMRLEPVRLREAAEAGDIKAMVDLWEAYKYGYRRGFSKDPAQELYWMTRAAEAGDGESIRQLAFAYQRGEIVEKDLSAAFYWFSKGAEAGGAWSMWELGHFYYLGLEPVEQDFSASLYWYAQSCKDPRGYA